MKKIDKEFLKYILKINNLSFTNMIAPYRDTKPFQIRTALEKELQEDIDIEINVYFDVKFTSNDSKFMQIHCSFVNDGVYIKNIFTNFEHNSISRSEYFLDYLNDISFQKYSLDKFMKEIENIQSLWGKYNEMRESEIGKKYIKMFHNTIWNMCRRETIVSEDARRGFFSFYPPTVSLNLDKSIDKYISKNYKKFSLTAEEVIKEIQKDASLKNLDIQTFDTFISIIEKVYAQELFLEKCNS